MARMVLLNLPDDQVDVLTRIQEQDPESNVVVVHPDENSLIRRLARLTDLEFFENPPPADSRDVVVATADVSENLLRPWNEVGASVVPPTDLSAIVRQHESDSSAPEPMKPETASENELPLSVLASPEATFRYISEQTLGAPATLWWDGKLEVWTPWVGEEDANGGAPPQGFQLDTAWGRFVVSGPGAETASWNQPALERVLGDMALRDLMNWGQLAEGQPELKSPGSENAENWFETASSLLQPEAAMLWIREGDRWSLQSVRGEGIAFSGTLRLSHELLQDHIAAWECCSPGDYLMGCFRFSPGRQRWPLILKRLELLGRGGAPV